MPEVFIDKVGSLGDGMGKLNGQTVFVPGTLSGELVTASGDPPRMMLEKISEKSNDRIAPLCKHFGTCGGCALQHMSDAAVLEWKQSEVALAFSRAHIETDMEPCISSSSHSRRRVTFSALRTGGLILLGFHRREDGEVMDIEHCPILMEKIESMFDQFRNVATTLIRGNEEIQIAVNACDNGLDLNLLLEQDPSEDMMAAFVRAFAKTPFLRAAINGDVVVEKEKPFVSFGNATVIPPPGGFLQAVVDAETAMAAIVCDHLKNRKRVVDLFSGCGTFSLRLAENSRVHAVETQSDALSALMAASGTKGLRSITTETRDLEELPLMASELKSFDGLCIDPPRAGAEPQIKEIAKASIRAIAYVSCNPTTLARDAAVLIKGGYILEKVTPIDQFVFSPHVEVVACFSKKPTKGERSIFR